MKHFREMTLVLLLIGSSLVAATPPALINYQGVLRDSAGAPRTGNFDMVFRFYTLSAAGTLLLTDTHNAAAPSGQVAAVDGLFTAQLGAGTITAGSEPNLAEVFRDNAAVWLEIQVGTETLSPRVRVTASAYAQNASSLQGVVNVSGAGNVGIAATTPEFKLSLDGDGGILAKGTYNSGTALATTGAGTRLIWYPRKAAFRSGFVDGAQWNDANIGAYSTAAGFSCTASGTYSTAMGYYAAATQNASTAIGYSNQATGSYASAIGSFLTAGGNNSTAMGISSSAGGLSSTAIGAANTASGDYSQAMGHGVTAQAYGSAAFGQYNVIAGSTTAWNATDPLFVVGNGSDSGNRSNALTVLKNGSTGINTATPSASLDVRGTVRMFGTADGPLSCDVSYTAESDGFVVATISKVFDGDRGYIIAQAGPTLWAAASIHDYYSTDVRVPYNSLTLPVRKGESYYVGCYRTAGSASVSIFWVPLGYAPPGFSGAANAAPAAAAVDKAADRRLTDPASDPTADPKGDLLRKTAVLPGEADQPLTQTLPVKDAVEPGDVLVMNPVNGDELIKCVLPADPMVVGIAAGDGLGVRSSEFGDGEGGAQLPAAGYPLPISGEGGPQLPDTSCQLPVVLGGVTLVKADALLHPIARGDLLTASATPGHAMKAVEPKMGTVIGKALEPLDAGTGLIKVLVMLR